MMCITLSVTDSFIRDFSFLPLEAVFLYILYSAIFLFRVGVKESKLGTYADHPSFRLQQYKQYSCKVHFASRGSS